MEGTKLAYFRELFSTDECELVFHLNVHLKDHNVRIDEEITVTCQRTKTVEFLVEHLTHQIHQLVNSIKIKNDDNNRTNQAKNNNTNIASNISLRKKSSNRFVKPTRQLKSLSSSASTGLCLHIFGQSFDVVTKMPQVREAVLPSVINPHYMLQPSRFKCLNTDTRLSEFSWYKSRDKKDWTLVGSKFVYKVQDDDVGYFLKLVCVPCSTEAKGAEFQIVSGCKVTTSDGLPVCPFEKRQLETRSKLEGDRFRVVSYNILSSRYAQSSDDNFFYCPPKFLDINYRRQLTSKELLGYNADIICLQEVDSAQYSLYYKDVFYKKGYAGYFHRKGNKIPEGMACIFDNARFKKIDSHQMVYSQALTTDSCFETLRKSIKRHTVLMRAFTGQLHSLQVTVLRDRCRHNSYLIVANTHLYYHPEAAHIRLLQIHMAVVYLDCIKKNYQTHGRRRNNVRLILCGDLNSSPSSAVFNYLSQGNTSSDQAFVEKSFGPNFRFNHNFNFQSACGTPQYTNYTMEFKDCLDYIFIEKDKLKVDAVISLPTEAELSQYDGLPNEVYPSDHLALVVDLSLL